MTPEERSRWREKLREATPIEVTDKYPGNPDYISTEEFEQMLDVLAAAVAEEREACARRAESYFSKSSLPADLPAYELAAQIAAAIRARSATLPT